MSSAGRGAWGSRNCRPKSLGKPSLSSPSCSLAGRPWSKAFNPQPRQHLSPQQRKSGFTAELRDGLRCLCAAGQCWIIACLRSKNFPWIGNKSGRCRIPSIKLMFQQFYVLYHTGTFAVFVFLLLHKVWPNIYCTMTMVLYTFRCWSWSWHKKFLQCRTLSVVAHPDWWGCSIPVYSGILRRGDQLKEH